jgi:hypothetical protein
MKQTMKPYNQAIALETDLLFTAMGYVLTLCFNVFWN